MLARVPPAGNPFATLRPGVVAGRFLPSARPSRNCFRPAGYAGSRARGPTRIDNFDTKWGLRRGNRAANLVPSMASEHLENPALPGYLRANRSAIVERWVAVTLPRLGSLPSRRLSFEEFRDDVPKVLALLERFLDDRRDGGGLPGLDETAAEHGRYRLRQGFNLRDLIRDWGNLQRVVLEWVNRFYESAEADPPEEMDHPAAVETVAAFFTEVIGLSVNRFDDLRRKEAARLGSELERVRRHFEQIDNLRKRLLKDLSHDMRSPLTAISGASSVLKAEEGGEVGRDDGISHEMGEIIDESVSSALELLGALQDLSEIDSGLATLSPSRVDVAALLREVLDRRRSPEGSGRPVVELSGPGRLEVEADAAKLRRTFESLLSDRGADGAASPAPVERMVLRPMEDGWELEVRYAAPVATGEADAESPREMMDVVVLRRLCLVQIAGFRAEDLPGGGVVVTLKFPLDYRVVE